MKKERLDKFSIRKLTVGAASVLIGVAFGATTVSAEKAASNQTAGTTTTVTPAPVAAELAEAKKAAHKALNDAGITGKILHDAIDAAKNVESVKAYVAEFTYHFTYKGAETTVSTDYVAASVDKAEQYFRAYASESGLNLDFTYDEATHTFVGTDAKPAKTVYHFQYDDKKGNSIRQDFATTSKDTAEMHFRAYASDNALSIDDAHFTYVEATHTFVYKDFESEKGEPEVLPAPAVDVLAEAKKVAHEEFTKAGITGKIFHDAIDAAKTVEGLKAYVAETLAAHKTVEPVTPTPAPVVSGETGIGYLNLDMLSDGFTGTLYVPVVGKDVNCKVRLLDDAGKYTNDYVVTDTTVKALASKVVNGVTFYKVAENRWIPAKFAEVLSDKEVAFKGVAKTFVKGHANYAVAMLDANGKYTGKFLKQGSSFKVFAKKVINGHLCYRLGTQAQWVPARFLVF